MSININRNLLLKEFQKFDLSSIQEEAAKIAEVEINKIRQEVLNDFENHPVTKEIEAGPDAENISATLNGIGNLSSYIGFSQNETPIEPVKNILKTIKIDSRVKKNNTFDGISFDFNVIAPSIDEIESVGKLPFEPGQSWIKGIENGISGFGAYIYAKMFKKSRSGKAIQSQSSFRQGAFRPVKYLSSIMEKFYSKIKK